MEEPPIDRRGQALRQRIKELEDQVKAATLRAQIQETAIQYSLYQECGFLYLIVLCISLRAHYAMPGTDIARMVQSAYAHARRYPVLTQRICLRACDGMSGTAIAYSAE
eukprot:1739249-Rhodomonas_salina.2